MVFILQENNNKIMIGIIMTFTMEFKLNLCKQLISVYYP